MRKRWKRIISLVLAGAAINLLVAWIVVVRSEMSGPHWIVPASAWPYTVSADWPPVDHVETGPGEFGFFWEGTAGYRRGTTADPRTLDTAVINRFYVGWPVHCWKWEVWVRWEHSPALSPRKESSAGIPRRSIWQNGIEPPESIFHFNRDYGWKRLPVRPGPLGFSANTAFYAALLWLLVLGPGAARRCLRRGRGQCPACGYPAGGAPACAECGRPVRPSTPRSAGTNRSA